MQQNNFYEIIKKNTNKDNFFFIQIGSNDGKSGDPLHKYIIKYGWQGILVEPVHYLYKKLLKTYSNQNNLIFKNVAIGDNEGYKEFYRIEENDEPNNPGWYDRLGSFNKDVVLKHKKYIPNFDKHFIKEKIKCITFDNLIKENNVKKIDLLHIDTEGYDFEIIKLIDFNKIKPSMILYEHKHLSENDKTDCMEYLKNKGYSLIIQGVDTFTFSNEVKLPFVRPLFRILRSFVKRTMLDPAILRFEKVKSFRFCR